MRVMIKIEIEVIVNQQGTQKLVHTIVTDQFHISSGRISGFYLGCVQ